MWYGSTLTSVIFFFLNRFTCTHNSKILNKNSMKEMGEKILKKAGHEQYTSLISVRQSL